MYTSIAIIAALVMCALVQGLVLLKNWDRAGARTRFRAGLVSLVFLALANQYVANSLLPYGLDRGSAKYGKVENGHYYVNKRGTYAEVPREDFIQALNFERGSDAVAYIAIGVLFFFVILPKMRPTGPQPPRPR
jgi:hypothetical protein